MASLNGHAAVVSQLVAAGSALDARNAENFTPLMWAAFRGHADVVGLLLEAGADSAATNGEGNTALDIAEAFEHAAAAERLRLWGDPRVFPRAEMQAAPLRWPCRHRPEIEPRSCHDRAEIVP